MIVVGGNTGGSDWSKRTDIFDYDVTYAWSKQADMKVAREFPATGIIGTNVYVVGGANDGGVLNSVETFDTTGYYPTSGANTWTLLASTRWMPATTIAGVVGVLPQPNHCSKLEIGGPSPPERTLANFN